MSTEVTYHEPPGSPTKPGAGPWLHTHHSDVQEKLFISISGLIGAGKTTLATHLGKIFDLPVHYEEVIDNAYLSDFYRDMARYSFPLQIYLLNQRFRQHQQIIWQGKGGVQDRTIYEDAVFAKILKESKLMEEREYRTYLNLFKNMSNFMRKPNLIVHLHVKPEESLERIKSRSRDFETGISLEYLTKLYHAYEEFINDISRVVPVIKVNWTRFQDPHEVAMRIKEEWTRMQNIHFVDFPPANPSAATAVPQPAEAKPSAEAKPAADKP